MYAAGQPHAFKAPCVKIMKAIADGRLSVAIDTEIVQGILYRYGAQQRWDMAVAMAEDVMTMAAMSFPVTSQDMRLTVDLFRHYAQQGATARDLVQTAVMKMNGLVTINSVDVHFDLIEGIQRIDPVDADFA
jgi:hypothetical protein